MWHAPFSTAKWGFNLLMLVNITDIATSYKPVVSMGDLQDPTDGGTLVPYFWPYFVVIFPYIGLKYRPYIWNWYSNRSRFLASLVNITDISTSYKPVVSMGDLQDPTDGGTLVPYFWPYFVVIFPYIGLKYRPYQEPRTIGVPIPYIRPIFQAYVREYHHKIWPKIWY